MNVLPDAFYLKQKEINRTQRACAASFSKELSSWQCYYFKNVDKMTFLSLIFLHPSPPTTLSVTYLELLFCCSLCCSLEVIVL